MRKDTNVSAVERSFHTLKCCIISIPRISKKRKPTRNSTAAQCLYIRRQAELLYCKTCRHQRTWRKDSSRSIP
ncbi:hypothetical protein GCK32_020452 [Trichostrongylus colubriformis]|uniref:Uncharacterized protein n=1 Tax=Trichostrongylus colubriformis TaxID=6319 RepID=A0AAN8F346_TRICO